MISEVDKLLHRIAVLEEAVTAAAITMVMDLGRENVVTADDRSAVRLLCAAIGWDPVRNPERAEDFVAALRATGPIPKDDASTPETLAMKIARLVKANEESLFAYNAASARAFKWDTNLDTYPPGTEAIFWFDNGYVEYPAFGELVAMPGQDERHVWHDDCSFGEESHITAWAPFARPKKPLH